MAKVVIAPNEPNFFVSGPKDKTSVVVSKKSPEKVIRPEKPASKLVTTKKEVIQVQIPALTGLPGKDGLDGERGEAGTGLDYLSEPARAFFESKTLPIREFHYVGDTINRIEFFDENKKFVYYQELNFEDDLLKEILLTRVEDGKTFLKTLYYDNNQTITRITIE